MRSFFWYVFACVMMVIGWPTNCCAINDCRADSTSSHSGLVPRYALFRSPSFDAPSLSPNGTMIAYLAARDGILNIWIRAVGTADGYQVTFEKERSIRRYFWSPDNTKLFYLHDSNGDENWHLFGRDLLTSKVKDYTPFQNIHASVVAVENSNKDSILIALNKENIALHDVYKLDIKTGDLTLVAKNPGNVTTWFADRLLHVRLAVRSNDDGGSDILFRNQVHSQWRKLFSWSPAEALSCSLIDFSYDGQEIYCLDNRFSNTVALVKFNLLSHKRTILGFEVGYDISGVLLHPRLRTVQGYSVFKQRKHIVALDMSVEADFNFLRNYAVGDISMVSRDYDDTKWIVAYVRDNGPLLYCYYDRVAKKIEPLFENKPELRRYNLARMEPITITARDGLTLEGYCTKPMTWNSGQVLPLVILVHGGPWRRDNWGCNMEAQWLANRGYICLQVNYRGSTGYGKRFLAAGEKEWGGKMLDDLVDVAQWAIDERIADPKRIAIMGSSYGGYAALCGTTMTDMFACGISVAGPAHLATFLTTLPPYFEPEKKLLYTMIGDPVLEHHFLQTRSPLFYVHNLKVPLLIAQGLHDPRVKKTESDQLINALIARKLDYDYMLFPDEGHVLVHEKNRLLFYARAECFLAKVLHGLHEA